MCENSEHEAVLERSVLVGDCSRIHRSRHRHDRSLGRCGISLCSALGTALFNHRLPPAARGERAHHHRLRPGPRPGAERAIPRLLFRPLYSAAGIRGDSVRLCRLRGRQHPRRRGWSRTRHRTFATPADRHLRRRRCDIARARSATDRRATFELVGRGHGGRLLRDRLVASIRCGRSVERSVPSEPAERFRSAGARPGRDHRRAVQPLPRFRAGSWPDATGTALRSDRRRAARRPDIDEHRRRGSGGGGNIQFQGARRIAR